MSELPKIVRARLDAVTVSDHPDADLLTAFREKSLPDRERGPVLAHLAQCADCREILAVSLPPIEAQQPVVAIEHSWMRAPWVRWVSVLACLVVVGAAVLIHPKQESVVNRPASETDVILSQQAPSSPESSAAANMPASPKEEPSAPPATATNKVVSPHLGQRVANAPASARSDEMTRSLTAKATVPRDAGELGDQSVSAVHPPAPPAVSYNYDSLKGAAPSAAPAQRAQEVAPVMTVVESQPGASAPVPASADNDLAKSSEPMGKAKPAPAAQLAPPTAAQSVAATSAYKAEKKTASAITGAPAQWMLSPQGQLQRSLDTGTTWEPVPVVENAKFSALSVKRQDIWVGGAAGLLYHSSDSGTHWMQVKPVANGVTLSAGITNVTFVDLQHGTLSTSDGLTWVTSDGGKTWQTRP